MTKIRIMAIINFIMLLAMITVNALANILPINGYNTGELSDLYPNLFVPTGLTFAIWGVIYLILLISVIVQLRNAFGKNQDASDISKMKWNFAISCIFNIAWIFAWHYRQLTLSLVVMLGLLIFLLLIYKNLEIGKEKKISVSSFFIKMPISIYLGWISIATIANVTAVLVDIKWDWFGISQDIWTSAMVVIGIILGIIYIMKNRDIYYSSVIAWALLGIYIKQSSNFGDYVTNILVLTICGIIILVASGLFKGFKKEIYHF